MIGSGVVKIYKDPHKRYMQRPCYRCGLPIKNNVVSKHVGGKTKYYHVKCATVLNLLTNDEEAEI